VLATNLLLLSLNLLLCHECDDGGGFAVAIAVGIITGKDMFGNTFYRGIYLGREACAIPIYYHYTINVKCQ
jgi:hypothetical protein